MQGNRKNAGPLNFTVKNLTASGYEGEGDRGPSTFVAPCSFAMRNSFPSSPNVSQLHLVSCALQKY